MRLNVRFARLKSKIKNNVEIVSVKYDLVKTKIIPITRREHSGQTDTGHRRAVLNGFDSREIIISYNTEYTRAKSITIDAIYNRQTAKSYTQTYTREFDPFRNNISSSPSHPLNYFRYTVCGFRGVVTTTTINIIILYDER